MWHWDSAATSSSSGFQRVLSPRNTGSALPAISGRPSALITWSRP